MNIRKFRNSFRVYIVDQQEDRRTSIGDILSAMDYRVAEHNSWDSAIAAVPDDPPHFVILGGDLVAPSEVRQILDLCPESHIVAVVDAGRVGEYFPLLSKGLYDVISWPLHDAHQLVAAIDRGAERDYFMYQNEQIKDQVRDLRTKLAQQAENKAKAPEPEPAPKPPTPPPSDEAISLEGALQGLQKSMEQIHVSTTLSRASECYLDAIYARTAKPACFFKYLPARRSLFLAHASGLDVKNYRGLGIDFNKEKSDFKSSDLKNPQELQALKDLIQSAFKIDSFCALPVDDGDGIKGVVVLLQPDLGSEAIAIGVLTTSLKSRFAFLSAQNRLHNLESLDPTTQVWNRENFEVRIKEEVSRARRTHLPLAMIIIGVDGYSGLRTAADRESIDLMMRSLAGMIRKNSRVNDIVGRMNEDELALLLPHTGSRGAAIKAERLRRMVEAADFTNIFRRDQMVTISLGVSEYPSYCHDGDELVKSADDALFQVKEGGENKVCLAALPEGFVADFEVGQG